MTVETYVVSGTGTWTWASQTNSPPNSKQIRSSSGDWQYATELHISDVDDSNVNHSVQLGELKNGDQIHIEHNTDSSRYVNYLATGEVTAVAASGYHTVGVTLVDVGGAPPTNGITVRVIGIAAPPPLPDPDPSSMMVRILLNPYVTEEMVTDLMHNMVDAMQQVTHMINYAEFKVNIDGAILTYEADVLPAVVGDPFPEPEAVLAP